MSSSESHVAAAIAAADLAGVQRLWAFARDPAERAREIGKPVAPAETGSGERRVRRRRPLVSNARGADRSLAREVGRRPDRGIEAEPTEPGRKIVPETNGARHGDGAGPLIGCSPPAQLRWRAPRPVQPVELGPVPDEGKCVSADAVVGRLGNRQDCGGSEGCIDGVAATFERTQAGPGRCGVARRDHPVGCDCRHPPPAARYRAPRTEQCLEVELHTPSIASLADWCMEPPTRST